MKKLIFVVLASISLFTACHPSAGTEENTVTGPVVASDEVFNNKLYGFYQNTATKNRNDVVAGVQALLDMYQEFTQSYTLTPEQEAKLAEVNTRYFNKIVTEQGWLTYYKARIGTEFAYQETVEGQSLRAYLRVYLYAVSFGYQLGMNSGDLTGVLQYPVKAVYLWRPNSDLMDFIYAENASELILADQNYVYTMQDLADFMNFGMAFASSHDWIAENWFVIAPDNEIYAPNKGITGVSKLIRTNSYEEWVDSLPVK